MKYRSFLFALLRYTIIPTTKAERATETPNTIQSMGTPVGEPVETLGRASLVTEGYKQS